VIRAALLHTDHFLRATDTFDVARAADRPWWWLPLMVIAFAPIYGGAMGSFQIESLDRVLQVLFAASKVPILLFATTAICMPAFFVLNNLLGLRDDFRLAVQAVFAAQAGMAVTLASLAPIIRFWYFSCSDYRAAILMNAALFAMATLAGQIILARQYRALIRVNPRHRIMAIFWLGLFSFVGIQMGWMLRPFIGDPTMPISFFRAEPFSNAYVVVAGLLAGR
jgi:hypothetical protein